MKTKLILLGLALSVALFTGCATWKKGVQATRTTAEIIPAFTEDVESGGNKIETWWDSMLAIFSTETPATATAPAK